MSARRTRQTARFFLYTMLALLLTWTAGCGKNEQAGKKKAGKLAPDFSLVSLDGKQLTRESLQGKVVILDFWATWCPPCRAAVPHLVELDKKYRDQGLVIIGISLDRGGKDEVLKFARENQVSYDLVLGVDNDILKSFSDVTSIPTIILLNQKSEIVFRAVGFNADISQTVEKKVKELLHKT
ncbi:MAG: TlpA family protein disulfide reductase [Deltaproteobacteria bacterium]|nr:TlpA family protein disulfide reductase [Deltaproteobacteria bacterium]